MMPQSNHDGDVRIAAFYRFTAVAKPHDLREHALHRARKAGLKGTLLISTEGVNATLCGGEEALRGFVGWLQAELGLADLSIRWSHHRQPPFEKLKVRVRPEIATLGVAGIDPSARTGEHVDPQRWNELLADPNTLVLDTRNRYEIKLGSFEGAVDPETDSFRDFPQYVERALSGDKSRPVAMFCTGGIRCEKASAFMLEQGFAKVYQLDGGILNYLEQVDPQQSRFRGECFVFDDRVTVDQELQPAGHEICVNCRMPITEAERAHRHYEPQICCPHCHPRLTPERRAGLEERKRQLALAAQREASA